MKKRSRLLLAGVVLAAALSIGALAADEPVKGGIYNISGTGATLTPQTESQGTITPTTDGDKTGYYANAVRMGVEATGLESGKQYLLLVLSGEGAPTEGNIAYIDQAAAGENGKVSFNAYPSALTSGTYTLGDVNNDGQIYSNDALFALQMASGIGTWTPTQKLAADVNKDGQVYSNDALFILQKAAGLPTVF